MNRGHTGQPAHGLCACGSGRTFLLLAHPGKCCAMIYCYWQPTGTFITSFCSADTLVGVRKWLRWLLQSFLPYRGRLAEANPYLLSLLPKVTQPTPAAYVMCLRWPWSHAFSLQRLQSAICYKENRGPQYHSSGSGLYSPWTDSTGADKSDIFSLMFLTATTFEAFSFHPSPCCCCRGCRSAPRSGDLPRKAAAAASAPCPCEHWMQSETSSSS